MLIDSEMIIAGVSLIAVIYFGYFILLDIKFFLSLASRIVSSWFVGEEQSRFKIIAYDLAGIIVLILLHELLVPLLEGVEAVRGILATVTRVIILAIAFLLVYHLSSQVYYLVRSRFEEALRKFGERFSDRRGEGEEDR